MTYTTFDNITLRQYQEIYAIQRSTMDDEDKVIQSMCVLTGMTEREVEEMTLPEFNACGKALALIFSEDIPEQKPPRYLKINGKQFGITYNPRQLSYGQYAEIQTWLSQSSIENMHRIVASLTYPVAKYGPVCFKGKRNVDKHPEIAEGLLDCNFYQVHSICVFFSLLWKSSIEALIICFQNDQKLMETMTDQQKEQMKIYLQAVTDGSIMPSK